MKKHKILLLSLAAVLCLTACGQASVGSISESAVGSEAGENSDSAALSDETYVMTKQEMYKDKELITTYTYDYNEAGELIRRTVAKENDPEYSYYQDIITTPTEDGGKYVAYQDGVTLSSGEPSSISTNLEYQYDAEGREVFSRGLNWDVTSEYDETGNLVKQISAYRQGSTVNTYEYEYDENGYLVKESRYTGTPMELTQYILYENDADGRQIHQRVFAPDGSEPDSYEVYEWQYEYDEQGRVTLEYALGMEQNDRQNKKSFTYDDNGRISTEYDYTYRTRTTYMPLSEYLAQA